MASGWKKQEKRRTRLVAVAQTLPQFRHSRWKSLQKGALLKTFPGFRIFLFDDMDFIFQVPHSNRVLRSDFEFCVTHAWLGSMIFTNRFRL
jgi:hypothetical protein